MIKLESLSPKPGSTHAKKRLGKGIGSGRGRSCTKGQKGQTSRSGNTRKESKEGGQMPLVRRVPKSGFSNAMFTNHCEWVNLGLISKMFKAGEEVSPKTLQEKGIIKCACNVKVLGSGKAEGAYNVSAHAFSKSAKEKIEKAGGKITVIENK